MSQRCLLTMSLVAVLTTGALAGCKQTPALPQPAQPTVAAAQYPAKPSVEPPHFKLVHQTENSLTLVTDENASDEQIEAILWQLHEAAQTHTFEQLGLPQSFIDKRDPIVWFHLYRGSKCASEKYTSGAYPCGASYHAAADYTLGSFSKKDRDDATLFATDRKETHLWNPDATH